jgi:hypothetical protein
MERNVIPEVIHQLVMDTITVIMIWEIVRYLNVVMVIRIRPLSHPGQRVCPRHVMRKKVILNFAMDMII